MTDKRVQRRLAAIAIADVVGYSRLISAASAGMSAARQGRRISAGWRPTAGTHSSGNLSPSVMLGIMLDHRHRAQPGFAWVIG